MANVGFQSEVIMKKFVTNDDLALLVEKASALRKLAKTGQAISADLDVEIGYIEAAGRAIARDKKRLHTAAMTKQRRAKIKEQIQRNREFRYCAQSEYGKKRPAFSEVISEIESVLRELTAIYVGT
jgi:hypothetical protein